MNVYGHLLNNAQNDNNENDLIGEIGDDSEEESQPEEWVNYTPEKVSIIINQSYGEEISTEVKITFNDLGYRVKDWGEIQRDGSTFSVNTEIERWTGPSGQAIKKVENSYSLGQLEEGEYEFKFKTWNDTVKTKKFSVF